MPKKTQFKNQCIFCNKNSTSAEHIFPRWLGRTLSYPTSSSTFNRSLTKSVSDRYKRRVIPKNTSNHASGLTTRKVCIECNNQWLSDIENTVQPIFTRIIHSEKTELKKEDQAVLAKWAYLLAIKWDLMEKAISGYQPIFYSNFYKNRTPPQNTRVWVGLSGNDDIQAYHRTIALYYDFAPNTIPNIRSTTLKIGPVVFHILTHEEISYSYIESANAFNNLLTQIHPFQTDVELHNVEHQLITSSFMDLISKACGMQHSETHLEELIQVEKKVDIS